MTRNQEHSDWRAKALVSTAAATSAGAAGGALAGLLGQSFSDVARAGVVAVLALLAVLLVFGGWAAGVRLLPQRDRETEQALVHYGPIRWAVANGALLGLGFTSRLGTWLWYAVPVGAFATGSAGTGALVYGTYGFARLAVTSLLAGFAIRNPTIDVAAKVLPWRRRAMQASDAVFAGLCLAVLAVVQ